MGWTGEVILPFEQGGHMRLMFISNGVDRQGSPSIEQGGQVRLPSISNRMEW
jgi:hypothetical protein